MTYFEFMWHLLCTYILYPRRDLRHFSTKTTRTPDSSNQFRNVHSSSSHENSIFRNGRIFPRKMKNAVNSSTFSPDASRNSSSLFCTIIYHLIISVNRQVTSYKLADNLWFNNSYDMYFRSKLHIIRLERNMIKLWKKNLQPATSNSSLYTNTISL